MRRLTFLISAFVLIALGADAPAGLVAGWTPLGLYQPATPSGISILPVADYFPFPPAGSEWPWLLNALMYLGALVLIMTTALLWKKLFGAHPPMSDQIETAQKNMMKAFTKALEGFAKKETVDAMSADCTKLKGSVSEIEKKIPTLATSEAMLAMERHLDKRRSETIAPIFDEITGVKEDVAGLKANSDTHTATLAGIDQKLTNLLTRTPRR